MATCDSSFERLELSVELLVDVPVWRLPARSRYVVNGLDVLIVCDLIHVGDWPKTFFYRVNRAGAGAKRCFGLSVRYDGTYSLSAGRQQPANGRHMGLSAMLGC